MLLKNTDTGCIFVYTDVLAKLPNMVAHTPESDTIEPRHEPQLEIAEPEDGADQDWRKIGKKSDLAEFARLQGFELDTGTTLQNMRAEYVALVQARDGGA